MHFLFIFLILTAFQNFKPNTTETQRKHEPDLSEEFA